MAAKKAVTMQSIAEELGVSKVTVSKALNGREGVSDELKEQILRLVQQRGYKLPDYGRRKTRKVAVIINSRFASMNESGRFYMEMYEKIISELEKSACAGMLVAINRNNFSQVTGLLAGKGNFDGLILLGILDQIVLDELDTILLPKVYVDIYDKTRRYDSVVGENIYSAYDMTKHLLRQGHRNIGFVGTVGATTSITDRYLGYLRALIEEGIMPQEAWRVPDRSQDGEAGELMLPAEMPSAFLCNCDEAAYRLIRKLKERGLRVPEDVSVTGYNNDVYAELSEPRLTTVEVNKEELGKIVAKRIVRRIEHPGKKSGEIYRVEGKRISGYSVRDINC